MTFKLTDQNLYCMWSVEWWSVECLREMFQSMVAWLDVGVKENRSDVDQEHQEDWGGKREEIACHVISFAAPALEHNTN